MTLTILQILYIVLIVFWSIIWTLLILVLIRVYKILWPITEMLEIYNKIKSIFQTYANIPEIIKSKVSETLNKKD
jgi:uncharacterized membrane protein